MTKRAAVTLAVAVGLLAAFEAGWELRAAVERDYEAQRWGRR